MMVTRIPLADVAPGSVVQRGAVFMHVREIREPSHPLAMGLTVADVDYWSEKGGHWYGPRPITFNPTDNRWDVIVFSDADVTEVFGDKDPRSAR